MKAQPDVVDLRLGETEVVRLLSRGGGALVAVRTREEVSKHV